jgi:hypothetical protein
MATTRYFVLAGLLVGGSSAHAAPSHRQSAVDANVPFHADSDAKRMLANAEEKAAPEDIADSRQRTSPSSWKLAIGPYVWASSVQVGSSTEIASAMTSVTGTAGSHLLDSAVSYERIGADAAPFSLAARSGVRYQRTTTHDELGVQGFRLQIPELVDAATTLDAGLRVSRTVSLTAGWGSLTTHRLSVITQLRGPRVALQFQL